MTMTMFMDILNVYHFHIRAISNFVSFILLTVYAILIYPSAFLIAILIKMPIR